MPCSGGHVEEGIADAAVELDEADIDKDISLEGSEEQEEQLAVADIVQPVELVIEHKDVVEVRERLCNDQLVPSRCSSQVKLNDEELVGVDNCGFGPTPRRGRVSCNACSHASLACPSFCSQSAGVESAVCTASQPEGRGGAS